MKLNDNFSVTGDLEGSYQSFSPTPGPSSDSLNIDSSQMFSTGILMRLRSDLRAAREILAVDFPRPGCDPLKL